MKTVKASIGFLVGVALFVGCQKVPQSPTGSHVCLSGSKGHPALQGWIHRDPPIINCQPGIQYSMRIVEPNPGIDYKIAIVTPDPNLDYKIIVVDPTAGQKIAELRKKSIDAIQKQLQQQTEKQKK